MNFTSERISFTHVFNHSYSTQYLNPISSIKLDIQLLLLVSFFLNIILRMRIHLTIYICSTINVYLTFFITVCFCDHVYFYFRYEGKCRPTSRHLRCKNPLDLTVPANPVWTTPKRHHNVAEDLNANQHIRNN